MGLSLMIAAVSSVTNWTVGPHLTMWLHGMGGVVLFYFLGRKFGLSPFAAAFGSGLLGASPLYLFSTLQAMSDVPAMVWCTLAIYLAWRSRSHLGWSFLAGAAVAVAVLIRPTNALIFLPVAVCLGLNWRRWLGLAVGGAPGVVFFALLNRSLYDHILTTGYGDVSTSFSRSYLVPALENYVRWLPVLLTPGLLLVFAIPWLKARPQTRIFSILLLWSSSFIAFYAFYFHTHESWWYLRFVLPAFPAFLLAMLLAGSALARRWSVSAKRFGEIGMICLVLAWYGYWTNQLHALEPGREGGEQVYPDAARWARANLPANSVIFCMQASGALRYYTDFTLIRYDLHGEHILPKVAAAASAAGRPIYAVLFPFETTEALVTENPGHWTQIGAMRHVSFWRFDGLEPRTAVPSAWHYLSSTNVDSVEVTIRTGDGWYNVEQRFSNDWCWSRGLSRLNIDAAPAVTRRAHLNFGLRGFSPGVVRVKQNGKTLWEGTATPERIQVDLNFEIIEGHAQLEFSTEIHPGKENAQEDSRDLAFAVYSPHPTFVSAQH
jgi:hypothetical protein